MSKSSPIYKYALQDEAAEISSILNQATSGGVRKSPEVKLEDEELDREKADAALKRVVDTFTHAQGGAASLTTDLAQITAFVTDRQEDQRIRRDTKIMRMRHKRLMLGCLQTLYYRKASIDGILNG